MNLPSLPIVDCLDELKGALAARNGAVLTAPPGSGKTTVVPLALLHEDWLAGKKIVVLEPRRLAARLSAERMAAVLGEPIGQTVGYRVRFEREVSAHTRIEVVTEGTMVRQLQRDPELADVGLLIFDEVHERSVDTDLSLALALDVRDGLRPDLRLLAMSATLDAESLASLLGTDGTAAPEVCAEGRTYPVAIHYVQAAGRTRDRQGTGPDIALVASTVRRALAEHDEDILVFLPGAREIARTAQTLNSDDMNVTVLPLHGDLPREQQARALAPSPPGVSRRRVILSTNVAETSLTIEGIGVVVDSGYARVPRFDPNSGLTRLTTVRVSQASADQRAGRAGRLGPGTAYRLWSQHEHTGLAAARTPEIVEAELAPLLLDLANWGIEDPSALRWLTLPPPGALAQAKTLLIALGALDERGHITATGRTMSRLPAHPRLARMLVAALDTRHAPNEMLAADIAALVEGRSPFSRRGGAADELGSDLRARLVALEAYRRRERQPGLDPQACRNLERVSRQLRARMRDVRPSMPRNAGAANADVRDPGTLLCFGYPDRIAQRRPGPRPRYQLANGRGAELADDDPLARAPYLVAADVDARNADGRIRLAAETDRPAIEWAQAAKLIDRERVAWDSAAGAVVAAKELLLGTLTLMTRDIDRPDPDALSAAMLQGVSETGLHALPWDAVCRDFRARVGALHAWAPEAGWPDMSDEALRLELDEWLGPFLGGAVRLEHLKRIDLKAALQARVSWSLLSRLDVEAPKALKVPSGRSVPLEYNGDAPPVLAVRLQEMFGQLETPRVASGKVSVMVHLLSPAGRPVQVTQDLAGFWERTYAEVKRELKGRYPKHYWPDDPYSAVATTRVRPPKR